MKIMEGLKPTICFYTEQQYGEYEKKRFIMQ